MSLPVPHMARGLFGILIVACAVVPAAAGPQIKMRDVADTDVERAIAEAKRYLYAQQGRNGHFRHYHHHVPHGGQTAIALFALLEAGENQNQAAVKKGLEVLAGLKTKNLYIIATRVMVLSQVRPKKGTPLRTCLEGDLKYLTDQALREGGAWGYGGPERTGDNSCSQFALLALWEADRAGIRINPALIRMVERAWLRRQRRDSGWTYAGQPNVDTDSTLSMTTAGLASLFICQDVLTNTCQPYAHRKQVRGAWDFIVKRLKPNYINDGYLAFCIQRVGMASGQKFIGEMDWFAAGAAKLAEPNPRGRGYRGNWGPVVRASFELIFLARGRIPLTFNKLQHGEQSNWNLHTRDVPHFTEFVRRNFERRMRWQVVKITEDVQKMLDAPILLVAGTQAAKFTPAQWGKLREYSLRGGTLLFVPTHNSKEFLNSVTAGLKDLYAKQRDLSGAHHALEPLPADHPLYSLYEKIPNGPTSAPMWGVSDGTRLLAVVSQRDLACPWQRRALARGRLDYLLGVNFFLYATGANSLRTRMRPVFIAKAGEVRHRAKVAWLRHNGNWNTQPAALDYLSQKLTAENRVAITTTAGAAPDTAGLKGQHLAWMTGSQAFTLKDAELKALRSWLEGGGTLFVNAVGGSKTFNASARKVLDGLFAGKNVVLEDVDINSPLMTGKCGDFRGPPIKSLKRTRAWQRLRPKAGPPLRVYRQAGRIVAIHAAYGIHDTLDGHTAHGAMSFMPPSARDLAANIVLYALAQASPTPKK